MRPICELNLHNLHNLFYLCTGFQERLLVELSPLSRTPKMVLSFKSHVSIKDNNDGDGET